MTSSCAALGIVLLAARPAGHAIGWGFRLQSPLFVTFLAALMLARALAMSGVFEITLPIPVALQRRATTSRPLVANRAARAPNPALSFCRLARLGPDVAGNATIEERARPSGHEFDDDFDRAPHRAAARASSGAVDVGAAWCITCKVNERFALDRSKVARRLKDWHVTVLRGDWTNQDPQISAYLHSQGAAGVPLYVSFANWRPGRLAAIADADRRESFEPGLGTGKDPY